MDATDGPRMVLQVPSGAPADVEALFGRKQYFYLVGIEGAAGLLRMDYR